MTRQTGLVRRGAVYYFRARVPAHRRALGARREVWKSLRTSDLQEARWRASLLLAELLSPDSKSPTPTAGLEVPSDSLPLDTLVDYWLTQKERRPRTIMEARNVLQRLALHLGHSDAIRVTSKDAIAFKDALIGSGLRHATTKKLLGLARAVFETATVNQKIQANPFKELKSVWPRVREKQRVSFSASDLRLIFQSPIYSCGERPRGGAGEAAFWIPLLALCTGMRLEEIAQLTRDDVRESGAIHFIQVADDFATGKVVKTWASVRRVPVHPTLIDLGFLTFVRTPCPVSHGQLFPRVRSSGVRQRSASWSQWFGRYLRRTVGIADQRKTFHSFRHTFKDLCREAGISKDLHDRLTGHSTQSVSDTYGSDSFPLSPLAAAVRLIDFSPIFSSLLAAKSSGEAERSTAEQLSS